MKAMMEAKKKALRELISKMRKVESKDSSKEDLHTPEPGIEDDEELDGEVMPEVTEGPDETDDHMTALRDFMRKGPRRGMPSRRNRLSPESSGGLSCRQAKAYSRLKIC